MVLFFVALFVMIGVVERTGLLEELAHGMSSLSGDSTAAAVTLLILFTAVTSGGAKMTWGEYLRVGGLILAIQTVFALGWIHSLFALDLFPELPS